MDLFKTPSPSPNQVRCHRVGYNDSEQLLIGFVVLLRVGARHMKVGGNSALWGSRSRWGGGLRLLPLQAGGLGGGGRCDSCNRLLGRELVGDGAKLLLEQPHPLIELVELFSDEFFQGHLW